ncbi:MAG: hypothetical protein AB1749_00700 [Pseudomonadota bacterium]
MASRSNVKASAGRQARSGVLPPPSALIEILAVVGAIVAGDRLLPDAGLLDIQPSLLWLPVLLASLHYGTVGGIVAAGLAIVSVVVLGLPGAEVGENHFAYLVRIWAEPMLWIAAAVLLGHFRLRQITERRELGEELAELALQRDTLAEHAAALRGRCQTLERALASRAEVQGPALVSALARVLDAGETAPEASCRLIALALPGAAASVFLDVGGVARRAAAVGWPPDARYAPRFGSGHPLREAVIVEQRSVSVLDADGERALAGEGLMAAPIIAGAGGPAIGLVKIEHAPAEAIQPATLAMLEAVALVLRVALDAEVHKAGVEPVRSVDHAGRARLGSGLVARLYGSSPPRQPASGDALRLRTVSEGRDRG